MIGRRLWAIGIVFALMTACENRTPFYETGDTSAEGETTTAKTGLGDAGNLPASGEIEGVGGKGGERPKPILVPGSGNFVKKSAASAGQFRELEGGQVTLNFVNASLPEVVQAVLGDILGVSYVIDPKVTGEVTVETAHPIARKDLLSTFETVLKVNGAALVSGDGYFKVVPLDQAVRSAPPVSSNRLLDSGIPGFAVQIVPLQHVAAAEMQSILEPIAPTGGVLRADPGRNIMILAGSRQDLRAMMDAIEIFDVDWLRGMSFGIYPIEYTDVATLSGELEHVMGADVGVDLSSLVRFVPIERLNALLVIARNNDYVELVGEWVSRLDRNWNQNDRRIFVYPVQNAKAADLAAIISDLFGGEGARATRRTETVAPTLSRTAIGGSARKSSVSGSAARSSTRTSRPGGPPDGAAGGDNAAAETADAAPEPRADPASLLAASRELGGGSTLQAPPLGDFEGLRVISDDANNALVFLATPGQYRTIESTLRRLDIVPLQVLIEATIAEVLLNDDLRYGVQWFFEAGATHQFNLSTIADSAPGLASSGFSYFFTTGSGNIKLALDQLAEVSDVKVISSPHLMVLGNQTAHLQVGDQVPILTRSSTSTTDGTAPIVNEIEYRDTGVILTVTPRVNPGGLVTLEVEQEASSVAETTTGATESPTIQQRRISSTVLVRSGESVALGGLIRDDVTKSSNGIPILKDIPILGFLFGRTSDLQGRTELVVILTPRVIANTDQAVQVTDELRRRMKGLQKWDKTKF